MCSGQGCSSKTASVLPACTICTGISKAPHAEGDRECRGLPRVALQLGLFDAAAAPPDLRRRQEAAGRLLDVHDAVCADAIGAQQPTQLDEEPMRVGVLLLLAALRTAAAGLLFDDCSGWGGRGGWSADVGDLLVCKRSGDGVSWLPPARSL